MLRRLLTAAFLFPALHAQPPCGAEPGFSYPAVGAPPAVRVWTLPGSNGGAPACAGWAPAESATVVRVAARFRFEGAAEDLRRRIGALSATAGLLYWSASDRTWQPLIVKAEALTAARGARRADFSPAEIAAGRALFFSQEDNRFGAAVYRMRIREASESALALDMENCTPLKLFTLQIFGPGEVQSVYSLKKEVPGVWQYYAVTRTAGKAGALLAGREGSAINRAVALYRYLAGIPADLEPPAAR